MEKRGKVSGGVIIDVNVTNTKGYVDQFPTASESNLKPSLVSTGEPEPFDPLSAINSVKRSNIVSGTVEVSDELDAAAEAVTANATSEKEETPTPESVAASGDGCPPQGRQRREGRLRRPHPPPSGHAGQELRACRHPPRLGTAEGCKRRCRFRRITPSRRSGAA